MELEKLYPSVIFKFCPGCGSKSFEPSSWHSHICTACGFTFFTNNSAAVAALIFNPEGKLLLTRRKHAPAAGMLDLPGGFVEPLESAERALVRELKEELNLDIRSYRYMASFPNRYLYNNLVYFTCDLAYVCQTVSLSTIEADDDVSEYIFVDPEKLDFEQIGLDSIKRMIRFYLEGEKK